jgi:hypothetical protein
MQSQSSENIMRAILLAAAALAFSGGVAFADDVMASRYGNTTITTEPGGTQIKIYYKADGTFTGKRDTADFSGTWKVDASNQLCLTFAVAMPGAPNPTCVPASAHKVGDTWGGGGVTISLVAGIQ